MIASALYFPGTVAAPETLVRDNRFYPGKAADCFPVWWQYLRRHYPDDRVVLFADAKSPVDAWKLVCEHVKEPYIGGVRTWLLNDKTLPTMCATLGGTIGANVEVCYLDQHCGQYFRPMQRNLVEAIIAAYRANDDLLWIDADAFLNTDLTPLIRDADVAAPQIAHHQMTMDSVCTYISAARLHAMDDICDLPTYLTTMLNEGPTETRMHSLQEGGLYKLFAYGRAVEFGAQVELSHLSCYDHFMAFLRRNPLDTPEYRTLVARLEGVDWSRMPGVERSFLDMDWPANAAREEAR